MPTLCVVMQEQGFDVELTLHALQPHNVSDRIHVVRDGAEALDFMFCRGAYAGRSASDRPKVVLLDLDSYIVKPVDFQQFSEVVRQIGLYWALLNEPPIS